MNGSKLGVLVIATLLTVQAGRLVAQGAAPSKIDVAPVSTQNQPGTEVPLRVQLLDAYGRPAQASRSFAAEVKVEQPSGQSATYTVTFSAGESSKQISVPINEAGLAKLTVRQQEQQLIGGSNFVLVRAGKGQGKATQAHQRAAGRGPGADLRDLPVWGRGHARLVYAAFALPQVPAAPATPASAQLVLTISGEDADGGTRADGKTCARVQGFYLGADDLQRDVQIWLSPSNGVLDNNPLVINKATALGSACWTSEYPIPAATLSVAATNPANFKFASSGNGADPRQLTHKFTDPIIGIEFVNPPQSITIVDSFNLIARFQGPSGPLPLSGSREVHFSADSAVLTIKPLQTIVQPGGFDSATVLVPTFFGKSKVQVSTPNYPPATFVLNITWMGVLFASLLGGLLGGVLAWINTQGKLWMRIVTGLIVGLVASWVYVVVGLPKVDATFLHNQLSVFFVALLVGLGGVKSLTFIVPKLGLPAF